jgi:hypothetical protein
MWHCPKCAEEVEDDFDVCWQCGTDREGMEDPAFVTADDSEAIFDTAEDQDLNPLDEMLEEFGEAFPELETCFSASNPTEARFVANQLRSSGIPAVSDRVDVSANVPGGIISTAGPGVRVRSQDLARAQGWVKDYYEKRRNRQASDE